MFDIFNDIPIAVFVTYSPKMVNLFDSWSQSFVRLSKFKSSYSTNSFRLNSGTLFSCLFHFSSVLLKVLYIVGLITISFKIMQPDEKNYGYSLNSNSEIIQFKYP